MELRRIGEALLRSQPATLFSLPCQQRLGLLSSRTTAPAALSHAASRAYSVSTVRRQQQSSPNSSPDAPSNDNASKQPAQDSAASAPSSTPVNDISTLLDSQLNPNRNEEVKRTSRFSSPNAQAENRNTTPFGIPTTPSPSSSSSADDAFAGYQNSQSSSTASPVTAGMSRIFRNNPNSHFIGSTLGDLGASMSARPAAGVPGALVAPPDPATLPRLGPNVGRSVEIRQEAGLDLAKGLRQLEMLVHRNRVRKDAFRQRFHERPGLKRKRLASERWRKRFKEGFSATVSRVQYLKRQGW